MCDFMCETLLLSQKDRQCTYNITLRRVRAIIVAVQNQSFAYSEGVSVALGIQHPMRMFHIAIYGQSGSTIFFTIISYMARFSKNVIEHKVCLFIFSTTFV